MVPLFLALAVAHGAPLDLDVPSLQGCRARAVLAALDAGEVPAVQEFTATVTLDGRGAVTEVRLDPEPAGKAAACFTRSIERRLWRDHAGFTQSATITVDPDAPLFGGELGLDSLDAVQLVSAIEKHYNVQIPDSELGRSALGTVSSIAELLRRMGARR